VQYAPYGPIGVILACLVVLAGVIALWRKPSWELFAVLGFLILVVVASIAEEFLNPDGPWIFVGTVQNPTKRITPDDNVSYAYTRQSEDNSTIEYVFYVSQSKLKEGDTLHLPLLEPQPGVQSHNAWFCFTRQHASYSERVLPSGDVQWERNGPTQQELCHPPPTSGAALSVVSPASAATDEERVAAATSQESNFV
jgi:hypothetical protein